MAAETAAQMADGWRVAVKEITRLEWEKYQARAALRCLPGFAPLLVGGGPHEPPYRPWGPDLPGSSRCFPLERLFGAHKSAAPGTSAAIHR